MATRRDDGQDMPPDRGRGERPQDSREQDRSGRDRNEDGYRDQRASQGYTEDDRGRNRGDLWHGEGRDRDRRDWDPANYGGLNRERGPGMAGGWDDPARNDAVGRGDFPSRQDTRSDRPQDRSPQPETGPHRGKGPKGYRRSDERIHEDVCDLLGHDDKLDASGISVTVAGGEVTLDGFVDTRMARRWAEDCVEACSGIGHIQNNLRLRDDGMHGHDQHSGDDASHGMVRPRGGQD
ncbi:BON domain-containing protein [Szabonella alba]|uniref:BON domain-containing protein n=1 Tax=Szabonella alba TaxID=2804194 RepID=A0A8K0Y1I5_9RHOB|nr:BON domain-containing protein [Szabonella alba]MBL4918901.1 BON domain-containing protein [Szabonella alba]